MNGMPQTATVREGTQGPGFGDPGGEARDIAGEVVLGILGRAEMYHSQVCQPSGALTWGVQGDDLGTGHEACLTCPMPLLIQVKGWENLMEDLYTFRDPSKVRRFLRNNLFLEPLLLEAHAQIEDYFPGREVALEVSPGHEDGEPEGLVAAIVTDQPPGTAVAELDRFDEGWWLSALRKSKGRLCITLEFA